nr:hypothetical protein CFP56_30052 [Quercus suber]
MCEIMSQRPMCLGMPGSKPGSTPSFENMTSRSGTKRAFPAAFAERHSQHQQLFPGHHRRRRTGPRFIHAPWTDSHASLPETAAGGALK